MTRYQMIVNVAVRTFARQEPAGSALALPIMRMDRAVKVHADDGIATAGWCRPAEYLRIDAPVIQDHAVGDRVIVLE
jgi:hypothetical protein